MERAVAHECAGKQARLGQHLEPVADANKKAAVIGVIDDGFHDRREPGDGPATEIVAVGKSPGQHHEIVAFERGILVPHVIGLNPENVLKGMETILVAIGPRETDDGGFHELGKEINNTTEQGIRREENLELRNSGKRREGLAIFTARIVVFWLRADFLVIFPRSAARNLQ